MQALLDQLPTAQQARQRPAIKHLVGDTSFSRHQTPLPQQNRSTGLYQQPRTPPTPPPPPFRVLRGKDLALHGFETAVPKLASSAPHEDPERFVSGSAIPKPALPKPAPPAPRLATKTAASFHRRIEKLRPPPLELKTAPAAGLSATHGSPTMKIDQDQNWKQTCGDPVHLYSPPFGHEATTPSIVLTPTKDTFHRSSDSALQPDAPRGRATSSVYSRYANVLPNTPGLSQNVPPVPPLPAGMSILSCKTVPSGIGQIHTSAFLPSSADNGLGRHASIFSSLSAAYSPSPWLNHPCDENEKLQSRFTATTICNPEDEDDNPRTPLLFSYRRRSLVEPPLPITPGLPTARRSRGWWNVPSSPLLSAMSVATSVFFAREGSVRRGDIKGVVKRSRSGRTTVNSPLSAPGRLSMFGFELPSTKVEATPENRTMDTNRDRSSPAHLAESTNKKLPLPAEPTSPPACTSSWTPFDPSTACLDYEQAAHAALFSSPSLSELHDFSPRSPGSPSATALSHEHDHSTAASTAPSSPHSPHNAGRNRTTTHIATRVGLRTPIGLPREIEVRSASIGGRSPPKSARSTPGVVRSPPTASSGSGATATRTGEPVSRGNESLGLGISTMSSRLVQSPPLPGVPEKDILRFTKKIRNGNDRAAGRRPPTLPPPPKDILPDPSTRPARSTEAHRLAALNQLSEKEAHLQPDISPREMEDARVDASARRPMTIERTPVSTRAKVKAMLLGVAIAAVLILVLVLATRREAAGGESGYIAGQ